MSRHREDKPRLAWWQKKRLARHYLDTAAIWLSEQVTDIKDIIAEIKEKNNAN